MITGNFVWRWGVPESLGVVAYGGEGEVPEWGYSVHKFIPDCDTANAPRPCWFCYLGEIPDIKLDTETQLERIGCLAKAFLKDIHEVYLKHNMALSHEDGQGAFMVTNYDKHYVDWLNDAIVDI